MARIDRRSSLLPAVCPHTGSRFGAVIHGRSCDAWVTMTEGSAIDRQASGDVILASASRTRQRLLSQAGLQCVVRPADIDEAAVRNDTARAGGSPEDAALALAVAKALTVGKRREEALVIGADQILECEGRWFEKPADRAEAAANLRFLRGRRHRLVSAVAVTQTSGCLWKHVDVAVMTMRPFSDAFLDHYLARVNTEALETVAGYRFEGSGVQLFSAIDGDIFTILGLPLLPLLETLRRCGVLAE